MSNLSTMFTDEYLLKKSNYLIQSKYSLDIVALKLGYVGMCMLQEGVYESVPGGYKISLTASQIITLFGEGSKRIYERLKAAAIEMRQCTAGWSNPEKQSFRYFPLYKDVSYENGKLSIIFNDSVESLLFNLRSRYSLLKSGIMMSFESAYTYKLYEYLRSNAYVSKYQKSGRANQFDITVNISELKFLMGVLNASNNKVVKLLENSSEPNFEEAESLIKEDNKYADWNNFRMCLRRAVNEINSCECCDLTVDYKKNGHANEVIFHVTLKKEKDKKNQYEDVPETLKTAVLSQLADILSSYGVTPQGLNSIAEAADYNIDIIKQAYQVMQQSRKVEYPVKFMIAAIKNHYELAVPVEKPKETRIHGDFERNYDSEFFKKLEEESFMS